MDTKEKEVTIVICTHNRSDLLRLCLGSLFEQTASSDSFEILVVDNASTDDTSELLASLIKKKGNLSYVKELETGLSSARNCGYMESATPWITYLDDDAIAHKDFVEKILESISKSKFSIIGGVYHQWFRRTKPDWFPEDEGTNYYDLVGQSLLPENKYASGGNMTVHRSVFEKIGGFKTSLGMKGEKIFYGEEIEFQRRARKAGFQIGCNLEIEIDHLVREEKLEIKWWLDSYYQKGKAAVEIFEKSGPLYPVLIIKGMGFAVIMLPYFLAKMMVNRKFKWGNFVIKYLGPLWYVKGQLDSLRNP